MHDSEICKKNGDILDDFVKKMVTFVKIMVTFVKKMVTFVKKW